LDYISLAGVPFLRDAAFFVVVAFLSVVAFFVAATVDLALAGALAAAFAGALAFAGAFALAGALAFTGALAFAGLAASFLLAFLVSFALVFFGGTVAYLPPETIEPPRPNLEGTLFTTTRNPLKLRKTENFFPER
jgi:hypothetical protein